LVPPPIVGLNFCRESLQQWAETDVLNQATDIADANVIDHASFLDRRTAIVRRFKA
jgi:hypothetical protein